MSTLLDKIWERHLVHRLGDECLLYVERNFVHEESTQTFRGLKQAKRKLLRPTAHVSFCDHYAPTRGRERGVAAIPDPEVQAMILQLERRSPERSPTFVCSFEASE